MRTDLIISEEAKELLDAIHANDINAIRHEAMQLSAAAMRLANEDDENFIRRSGCTM